jgi:hypothetical protein
VYAHSTGPVLCTHARRQHRIATRLVQNSFRVPDARARLVKTHGIRHADFNFSPRLPVLLGTNFLFFVSAFSGEKNNIIERNEKRARWPWASRDTAGRVRGGDKKGTDVLHLHSQST